MRLTRLFEYAVWFESSLGLHIIFLNLSQAVVEFCPRIHKLTMEERTDGWTNMMFIGRSLSTGHAMC